MAGGLLPGCGEGDAEGGGGGEAAQKMVLHGRSARYNQTLTDIYVNMLRGTTAAFAAE